MSLPDVVFAVAVGVALGVVSLLAILGLLGWLLAALEPNRPAQCDIDPRNHPYFCVGSDGAGYIGNVRIEL